MEESSPESLLSPIIAGGDWSLDWFCHAASLARELNVDLTSYNAVFSLFYIMLIMKCFNACINTNMQVYTAAGNTGGERNLD